MTDDKRFYRNLKKEIKKTGNRKRRRYLNNLETNPDDFDYGFNESSALNGKDKKKKEDKNE